MGGSSSVSFLGTSFPKPDSSPRIFERSIPLRLTIFMKCEYLCRVFSWSDEFFDVTVGENFEIHQLFG
jgi:hypothetical protein